MKQFFILEHDKGVGHRKYSSFLWYVHPFLLFTLCLNSLVIKATPSIPPFHTSTIDYQSSHPRWRITCFPMPTINMAWKIGQFELKD